MAPRYGITRQSWGRSATSRLSSSGPTIRGFAGSVGGSRTPRQGERPMRSASTAAWKIAASVAYRRRTVRAAAPAAVTPSSLPAVVSSVAAAASAIRRTVVGCQWPPVAAGHSSALIVLAIAAHDSPSARSWMTRAATSGVTGEGRPSSRPWAGSTARASDVRAGDELSLPLGHGGEHGGDERSVGGGGIDINIEHAEAPAGTVGALDDAGEVKDTATEPVELGGEQCARFARVDAAQGGGEAEAGIDRRSVPSSSALRWPAFSLQEAERADPIVGLVMSVAARE